MHAGGIRMFFSAHWEENQCKIFHLNSRYGTVCNTSTTLKFFSGELMHTFLHGPDLDEL